MRFVPTEKLTYWWPIKINTPHPDKSGQWKQESFEMLFTHVGKEEAKRLADEFAALNTEEDRQQHIHDQLLEHSIDWRGVEDGDKKPVPFTREMLLAMLNYGPWYPEGIYASWTSSLAKEDARRGN